VVPSVELDGLPDSSTPGVPISVTGSVRAPDPAASYTFIWTVTRDGSDFASGSGSDFTFTPDQDGTYAVTLTVSDDSGGSDSVTGVVVVSDGGAPWRPPGSGRHGPAALPLAVGSHQQASQDRLFADLGSLLSNRHTGEDGSESNEM
jgi:hypothetical protein